MPNAERTTASQASADTLDIYTFQVEIPPNPNK